MPIKPLRRDAISQAMITFLEDPLACPKLEWWLLHGHSCERWLQFEWAFHLQRVVGDAYTIACEVNRVDVACFDNTGNSSPILERNPAANIELKFYGNWWFDPSFSDVRGDLDKIATYPVPSLALVFALFATPPPEVKDERYAWIAKQIPRKGVGSVDTFKQRLAEAFPSQRLMEPILDLCCGSPSHFESIRLCAFGFYNSLA